MAITIMREERRALLVRPASMADIYVDGLHAVERLGNGNFRFVCYTHRPDGAGRPGPVDHVNLCFVAPRPAIPPALFMAAETIGWDLIAALSRRLH